MSVNRELTEATEELNTVRAELNRLENLLYAGEIVSLDDYTLAVADLNLALDRVDSLLGIIPWHLWMLWFVGYTLMYWLLIVSISGAYWFGAVIPVIGIAVLTRHILDFMTKMRYHRHQAQARLRERNGDA